MFSEQKEVCIYSWIRVQLNKLANFYSSAKQDTINVCILQCDELDPVTHHQASLCVADKGK